MINVRIVIRGRTPIHDDTDVVPLVIETKVVRGVGKGVETSVGVEHLASGVY